MRCGPRRATGGAGSSPRVTEASRAFSDLGGCNNIVIYCFFSHVNYQIQREGKKLTKISGTSGTLFLLGWSRPLWSSGSGPLSSASFPADAWAQQMG